MFNALIYVPFLKVCGIITNVFREEMPDNFQRILFPRVHVCTNCAAGVELFEPSQYQIVVSWLDAHEDTLRGQFLEELRTRHSWRMGRQILVCVGTDFTNNQAVYHWKAWRNSVTMHNPMIYADTAITDWANILSAKIKNVLCWEIFQALGSTDQPYGNYGRNFALLALCAGLWWDKLEEMFKNRLRQEFHVDESQKTVTLSLLSPETMANLPS